MGAIISHINYADSATITNSIGTVIRALSGMQTPFLRGLARSTGSGTPPGIVTIVFDVDLGAAKSITTIGCIGLNADEASGGDAGMLVDLSLTGAGNDEVLSAGQGTWDTEWMLETGQACWLHCDTTPWSARYVRIRLDVSRPAGAGYIDVRRLWIGGGVFIDVGFDDGWTLSVIDGSETTTTQRGGFFAQEYEKRRQLQAAITARSSGEIIGSANTYGIFGTLARVGRTKEVVVTPRSNYEGSQLRDRFVQTIYGTISEWSPIRDNAGTIWGLESLTVDELPYPALS